MDNSPGGASIAARALAHALHAETVDVEIDGMQLALAISVDPAEHHRRRLAGTGAVTSTGMLHGLWLLPSGGAVPTSEIPSCKQDWFRSEPGWVREGPAGFQRLYNPAGVVTAAAVSRVRRYDSVRIAAALPPIFERYIVAGSPSRRLTAAALDFGVGVIAAGQEPTILVEPQCVTGRPAVYRWWLAEIAYEQWLQTNAQPVS